MFNMRPLDVTQPELAVFQSCQLSTIHASVILISPLIMILFVADCMVKIGFAFLIYLLAM